MPSTAFRSSFAIRNPANVKTRPILTMHSCRHYIHSTVWLGLCTSNSCILRSERSLSSIKANSTSPAVESAGRASRRKTSGMQISKPRPRRPWLITRARSSGCTTSYSDITDSATPKQILGKLCSVQRLVSEGKYWANRPTVIRNENVQAYNNFRKTREQASTPTRGNSNGVLTDVGGRQVRTTACSCSEASSV